MSKETIHVATIEHRHGFNCYAARSPEGVDAQLADYCREWWHERAARKDKRDLRTLTDREVIDLYFEDHDAESYTTHDCVLED